jgi:hypothetical protein
LVATVNPAMSLMEDVCSIKRSLIVNASSKYLPGSPGA